MRTYRLLTATGAALALASCAHRKVNVESGDVLGMRWTASLAAPRTAAAPAPRDTAVMRDTTSAARDSTARGPAAPMPLIGSAVIAPGASANESHATVLLANGTPGASHPWHVHIGQCGNDKGVVGPANAYTPITIGPDGKGQATVTLPFSTPTSGEYFVNVHLDQAHMQTIVACGNLTLNK